jgi:hypothetical protein
MLSALLFQLGSVIVYYHVVGSKIFAVCLEREEGRRGGRGVVSIGRLSFWGHVVASPATR